MKRAFNLMNMITAVNMRTIIMKNIIVSHKMSYISLIGFHHAGIPML